MNNLPTEEANKKTKILVGKPWMTCNVNFSALLPLGELPGEIPKVATFLNGYLAELTGLTQNLDAPFRYVWNPSEKNPRSYLLQVFLNAKPEFFTRPSPPAKSLTITRDGEKYLIDNRRSDRATKNTVEIAPPPTII